MGDFGERIQAEIPALRRYARALLRERDRAEDLLQDCLERALSRRHLFIRPVSLRAWLFRIMHNIHANNIRAASRRPALLGLDDAGQHAVQPDQIPRIEVAETLAAFDRLSVEQREVLLLVVIEGLSYRDAARVLGVPEGTVMSRVARAREELREAAEGRPAARLRRVK